MSFLRLISTALRTTQVATIYSGLLHIVLLSTLALILLSDRPVERVLEPEIVAVLNTEEPDLPVFDLVGYDIELPVPSEPMDSLLTVSDITKVGASESIGVAGELPPLCKETLQGTVSVNREKKVRPAGRRGKGIAAGKGVANGQGSGPGRAAFFGTEVQANSVAFVIDASGSMSGTRFNCARNELANSLKALRSKQRFFVVCYADTAYPQFYPNNLISLIAANEANTGSVIGWMERSQANGGTEPQQALEISLGLKPEVLFFLSDGEIPSNTRDIVRRANRGTVIHTIAFGSNAGGQALKDIASDNGGTYRLVADR